MRDTSRRDEAEHLAPVSYLPWAVPGVEPGTGRGARATRGDAPAAYGLRTARDTERVRDTHAAGDRHAAGDAVVGDGETDDDMWDEGPVDDACARLERQSAARQSAARQSAGRRTSSARGTGPARPVARIGAGGDPPASVEPGVERDERIDRLVVGRLRRSSLSVAEVRDVLTEHGLDEAEVDEWIERYERLGYLNDVRLAEQLVRTGAERRGRGSGAILAELTRRGVSAEATRAALDRLDPALERDNALAVAERRARQLRGLESQVAERRLTAFLQRRGYDAAVVREAVATALSSDRH